MNSNFKRIIIGITVSILIVCCVIFITIFMGNKKTQEQVLKEELKILGIDYYKNFYYPQVSKSDVVIEEYLGKYSEIGLKISLNDILKINTTTDISEKFINEETNEECDKVNSIAIIYPKSPYQKEDYKIEVSLECGFNNN